MPRTTRIGLIGDYNPDVIAHRAIPVAIEFAAKDAGAPTEWTWVPTDEITGVDSVNQFDGLWCVPACPYKSMEGALTAIRYARESGVPFFGSCGGFQHAVIEFARNVLDMTDADHAETSPDSERAIISLLSCSLVEESETIHLDPGSRMSAIYGVESIQEDYHCRYGINPEFQTQIFAGRLKANAIGEHGEIRGLELDGHPFFFATLFQSERGALKGVTPPLALALVQAASKANFQ